MSAIDDTIEEKLNWHWRNTMRPVRFFNLDARAVLPFCILLFYARLSTLILTIIITIAFYILERRGLTFPSAMRALRLWFTGPERSAWSLMKRRSLKDFG
jgi:intracellular multiplication protein IcmT